MLRETARKARKGTYAENAGEVEVRDVKAAVAIGVAGESRAKVL